jgi:ankyrin repeat protein
MLACSALVHAVLRSQKEIVDILLRSHARIEDVSDLAETALHVAASKGCVDVLALLLARQPNLCVKNAINETPLEYALLGGNVNAAAMLLAAGAPLDGLSARALCPLAAINTSAIQALTDRGVVVRELRGDRNETPLHWAARWGCDRAVFSMLVDVCGVDVEARALFDQMCSHNAALHDRDDAGANLGRTDRFGSAP